MAGKILKKSKDYQFPLETIPNNLNSSIYIADMKSHVILFMNNHMKDLYGSDLTGSICWESIHENLKGPCKFCTNDKLTDADGNPTEPHIWEFHNKKIGRWYELHDQAVPWIDGHLVRMEIAIDITDRKRMEQALKETHEKLEKRVKERTSELGDEKIKLQDANRQLMETNKALSTLARNIERTREDTEAIIENKTRASILPIINKLQQNKKFSSSDNRDLKLLMDLVSDLTSRPVFKQDLSTILTSTELRVALLIKNGLKTSEIAEHMYISPETVKSHRRNIRKKLDLNNSNRNLGVYLNSFFSKRSE